MTIQIPPAGTHGARMPKGRMLRVSSRMWIGLQRRFPTRGPFKGMGLLTTVGAKSGQQRTAPVAVFPEGSDGWLVVGSNGGAAWHPSWYINLAHHPDDVSIQVGDRNTKVTPEMLVGPERAAAWQRIVKDRPNFGPYETKTDRQVPVVRLTAKP